MNWKDFTPEKAALMLLLTSISILILDYIFSISEIISTVYKIEINKDTRNKLIEITSISIVPTLLFQSLSTMAESKKRLPDVFLNSIRAFCSFLVGYFAHNFFNFETTPLHLAVFLCLHGVISIILVDYVDLLIKKISLHREITKKLGKCFSKLIKDTVLKSAYVFTKKARGLFVRCERNKRTENKETDS